MFFDKDQNSKRQMQKVYYQGLKQEIQMKNSKLAQKRQPYGRQYEPQAQQFSLIKNIQTEQQNRKNKKSQYYSQLRKQLQDEKNKKQRHKQEQKRLQKIQEQKINKQNQILRQRYEQQIKKEKKSSTNNNKEEYVSPQQTAKNSKKNTNIQLNPIQQRKRQFSKNNEDFKRLKTSDSQQEDHQPEANLQLQSMNYGDRQRQSSSVQLSYIPTYINRIQNEPFNYIPKKRHMDSYFKQLLVHRRQYQHEASGISQLNKLFRQQRHRPQKIQSRGLEQLKNLQTLLQQKSSQYMSNLNSRSTRSYQIPQNSMFKAKQSKFYQPKDQWRRLD